MDRNIHDDYFERFLRESVEEFRMVPSRRVWTSLYNNLHPGKKWPSLAVCIFLLSAVIYIGLSNAAKDNRTASVTGSSHKLFAGQLNSDSKGQPTTSSQTGFEDVSIGSTTGNPAMHSNQPQVSAFSGLSLEQDAVQMNVNSQPKVNSRPNKVSNDQIQRRSDPSRRNNNSAVMAALQKQRNQSGQDHQAINLASGRGNEETYADGYQPIGLSTNLDATTKDPLNTASKDVASVQTTGLNSEREWIDNHAFYNKPKQGFKNRLTYQIYATPSIGFRNMNSNIDGVALPASLVAGNSSLIAEKDHGIVHTPALNLEAGYSLIYSLSKTFRIKGGMQLNYSNYYVHAQQMDHPMGTSMLINGNDGLEMINRPSSIANNQSEENARKFSNNSFQLSLPIGADIRLAGNTRFQWFAGATIQPTYVLSGNAFMLSSDMKNYVFDANFVRKWNLNAGFETFVTFKVNQAVMINAGPQFRYQFKSSYIDQYTYDVKLYNLGIKLGIVQQF